MMSSTARRSRRHSPFDAQDRPAERRDRARPRGRLLYSKTYATPRARLPPKDGSRACSCRPVSEFLICVTLGRAAARNGTAIVRAPAVDDIIPPSMRRTGPTSAAVVTSTDARRSPEIHSERVRPRR